MVIRESDSSCKDCVEKTPRRPFWVKIKYLIYYFLRNSALKMVELDVKKRVRTNPVPTQTEFNIGAFKEMIEPQAKDAIFKLFEKGYETTSSGFNDWYPEQQDLQGLFTVDNKTEIKLKNNGFEVIHPNQRWTMISWCSENDLKAMKKRWDFLAELLPKKNIKKIIVDSPSADEFRSRYPVGKGVSG